LQRVEQLERGTDRQMPWMVGPAPGIRGAASMAR
jgi:hypothetical protein